MKTQDPKALKGTLAIVLKEAAAHAEVVTEGQNYLRNNVTGTFVNSIRQRLRDHALPQAFRKWVTDELCDPRKWYGPLNFRESALARVPTLRAAAVPKFTAFDLSEAIRQARHASIGDDLEEAIIRTDMKELWDEVKGASLFIERAETLNARSGSLLEELETAMKGLEH